VDADTCEGCGTCEEWCQVDAVSVSANISLAVVDLNRCIGCGVCVSNCPTESIALIKKPEEVKPPQTREELHDIIMANKKGPLGKLKLTGKMIIDSVRTGRANPIKS
jgi:ferredoxin